MPDPNGALTPQEAGLASLNAYYTLQGWSAYTQAKQTGAPKKGLVQKGMESSGTAHHEILGGGSSSLGQGGIQANVGYQFKGVTGAKTKSGFGYVAEFTHKGQSHVILSTRGTRMEMGPEDLLTDLYATPSSLFMDAGPVHRGFKRTFNSIQGALDEANSLFASADAIHVCGHSLGGAIANLNAYYLKSKYPSKSVNLYTFGAPRVGIYQTFPKNLAEALGKSNIYRVSHHMDPITMIPMFPYAHVLESDDEPNCMVLPSPSPTSPGLANHNMVTYTKEMQRAGSWDGVRALKQHPSFEDRMMKNIWENQTDNMLKKGAKLVGGALVWVLMKLLKGILKAIGGFVLTVIGTPMDLLARLIYLGVSELRKFGSKVWDWLKKAASFVGEKLSSAAEVTTRVVRKLLEKFADAVRIAAIHSFYGLEAMGGAWAMPYGVNFADMYAM
jgi:hypothetical protein